MNSRSLFKDLLPQFRKDYEPLFDPPALKEPDLDKTIPVRPIDIPTERETVEEGIFEPPPWAAAEDGPWDEPDQDDPMYDPDDGEVEPYGGTSARVSMELLAIYRPFHKYPDGNWGVLFHEKNMVRYTNSLYRALLQRRQPIAWGRLVKIATYSVARHEFQHYLTELAAFDLELKQGRRVYRPYEDQVYKTTFPSAVCLEEAVANVWAWDNAVVRSPAALREVVQDQMRKLKGTAYARGASLDRLTVRDVEDELSAQWHQCAVTPSSIPPVWGSQPRPYVQPWTRYENVPWEMTMHLGGKMPPLLNAGPLRRTMKIYHR